MTSKMIFVLLLGLTIGVIFMNIPPALNRLMPIYGVSYTGISILISGLLWSHALVQIPAGMIADRLGILGTLSISLMCMCVGNLIPSFYPHLGVAIGGRVAAGVGTGLGFVTGMKLVAVYAPAGRRGAFQAFFGGFFSVGSILAYAFIPRLSGFGWQWVYLTPALMCLPLLAMVFGLGLRPSAPAGPSPLPLGRIFRIRSGWVLGVYHALSYGSVISLGNWVPSLLAEVWGASTVTKLAWGGALAMLVSGLGRLSGGVILMRFSPLLMANGTIFVLSLIFICLFLVAVPVPVLTLALMAAWFASINFGALFYLASRAAPPDSMGTFFGFVNFLANLGAVLFTLMFGLVKDATGSFSWGFGALATLSLAAFVLGRSPLRETVTPRQGR